MKRITGIIAGTLLTLSLWAQKADSKDYLKMKDELNERIFGTPDPYFKENGIPEKYKNESAVILAQKHSLESDSRFKFRFSLLGGTGGAKYNFFEIFREKILLNDKSALEEYSELSFRKLQAKNRGYLGKLKNYTFINIRVIKPGGSIKTVNVDESAVTVSADKDEQKNKIAIPDLGVGDILDYYVVNYYQEEGSGTATSLHFVLADEYPVLNYIVSLQFDGRIAAEYQCINGAPDFKVGPDEDGSGNVLRLAVKDVPKTKGLIWSSSLRQMPIIRLSYKRGRITRRGQADIREGQVEKVAKNYADLVESDMASAFNDMALYGSYNNKMYKELRSDAKDAWKKYVAKHPKANKPDSTADFIFRYLVWTYFYSGFDLETNFNNAYYAIELPAQVSLLVKFAFIMKYDFDTDLDLLVLTGKNSYARENVFSLGDLSVLLRTRGAKPKYYSFGDNFDFQHSIPASLQGEKARVYAIDDSKRMGLKTLTVPTDAGSSITLPKNDYKDNHETEWLAVQLDADNPQVLQIQRKVTSQGSLKKNEQALMTIFEEMALQSANTVGISDDLVAINNGRGKAARKEEEELQTLIQKARKKHKEDFEREIKQSYSEEAKDLKDYRILNFGTSTDAPFEFEENFKLENWVKKAGNNYIVDIGKFFAGKVEIEKDQRERSKDVYMPFPRSFTYHIEFSIPSGYTAEGLDKLNSVTENKTGAFTVKARLDANKLVLDIEKYYINDYEPASNWPMLLQFLDKATEFYDTKILLKKA